MSLASRACTCLIFALGISRVLGGAVFPAPLATFSDPQSFKVVYPPTPPNQSAINVGQTPFSIIPEMLTLPIAPCSVLSLHVHPRGTEFGFVTAGTIEFGIFTENGTHVQIEYNTGDGFVIPQGSVHYTRNTGCSMANAFVFFDNPNPGTVFIGPAVSSLPLQDLDIANNTAPNFNLNNLNTTAFFNLPGCQC